MTLYYDIHIIVVVWNGTHSISEVYLYSEKKTYIRSFQSTMILEMPTLTILFSHFFFFTQFINKYLIFIVCYFQGTSAGEVISLRNKPLNSLKS